MTSVNLVWITPNADQLIADMARVSNPPLIHSWLARAWAWLTRRKLPTPQIRSDAGLIRYLITHKHWSPFEMASLCVEIHTTRDISAQLLRHRSFSFQEFSQRYSDVRRLPLPTLTRARKAAAKNRQSSVGEASPLVQLGWNVIQRVGFGVSYTLYGAALRLGVPREQARRVLPLATPTRLYMAGTLRSWIHYLQLRTAADTQAEHREIAEAIAAILKEHAPLTFAAAMEAAS